MHFPRPRSKSSPLPPTLPDGYLYRALAEMNRQKYTEAEQDLTKLMGMHTRKPDSLRADGTPSSLAEAIWGGD